MPLHPDALLACLRKISTEELMLCLVPGNETAVSAYNGNEPLNHALDLLFSPGNGVRAAA